MSKMMIIKKVVLVGDFSIGKTSLIRRYVENEFSDDYLTTIGVKISKKTLQVDTSNLQLMLWDIEGHTSTKKMNPSYIAGAHGLVLVVDATRESSIDNIGMHIQECRKVAKDASIILAMNKYDLVEDIESLEKRIKEIETQHKDIDAVYVTSAKDGLNVENAFIHLSNSMISER